MVPHNFPANNFTLLCRKLAETPFPFPYVQFITCALLMYTTMFSIMVNVYITDLPLNLGITFLSTIAYYAMNELARDLEDPFIHAPNDLPMARYNYKFNERIVAMARSKRPASNTEMHIVRLRTLTRNSTADSEDGEVRRSGDSLTDEEIEDRRVGGKPLETSLPPGQSLQLCDLEPSVSQDLRDFFCLSPISEDSSHVGGFSSGDLNAGLLG